MAGRGVDGGVHFYWGGDEWIGDTWFFRYGLAGTIKTSVGNPIQIKPSKHVLPSLRKDGSWGQQDGVVAPPCGRPDPHSAQWLEALGGRHWPVIPHEKCHLWPTTPSKKHSSRRWGHSGLMYTWNIREVLHRSSLQERYYTAVQYTGEVLHCSSVQKYTGQVLHCISVHVHNYCTVIHYKRVITLQFSTGEVLHCICLGRARNSSRWPLDSWSCNMRDSSHLIWECK